MIFLFHLLSTTSKPFSSLSTRLAHAARLGFFFLQNALYKFAVITVFIIWENPPKKSVSEVFDRKSLYIF